MSPDLIVIFSWWFLFFLIGIIFLPLTTKIFSSFVDRGYIFAKILGVAVLSYLVFLLGSLKILPFRPETVWLLLFILVIFNYSSFLRSFFKKTLVSFFSLTGDSYFTFKFPSFSWAIFAFEEVLFFLALFFWAWVRANAPDIHGLEKFMDFGFINSLLRSEFFPPKDLWLTPQTINYYYFGHLVTAVLTKLSGIPPEITFNLMLATLFGLTFTGAFSLGLNMAGRRRVTRGGEPHAGAPGLLAEWATRGAAERQDPPPKKSLICGLLSAFLVTLGGNLHAFYAFTRGFDRYWYPDATRFIPYTIHEFPSYSWVVSDLHGHVLDIPFVLLTLAILLSLFTDSLKKYPIPYTLYPIPFVLAVMYMTNAWDGIIYFALTALIISFIRLKSTVDFEPQSSIRYYISSIKKKSYLIPTTLYLILLLFLFFLFSLPFTLNFKPFVFGIGLARDHSPFYMLAILWGFFYFFAISFLVFLRKTMKQWSNVTISDVFVLLLIFISTLLLIFPEVAYIKDIYPLHYRANTMFKLGYQAFIMLSLSSAYIFMRIASSIKYQVLSIKRKILATCYLLLAAFLFIPIAIYPYFAIKSYYNNLKTYEGLDGMTWLKKQYPQDFQAIQWLRTNIKGQPVILEAVGESYTDFARVSSFTGLPTVVGWPVHEWLWRGSYDEAGKREAETGIAYDTASLEKTKEFLEKYRVKYVFAGTLERQKYPAADFEKWERLGRVVFQSGQTSIYQIPE